MLGGVIAAARLVATEHPPGLIGAGWGLHVAVSRQRVCCLTAADYGSVQATALRARVECNVDELPPGSAAI